MKLSQFNNPPFRFFKNKRGMEAKALIELIVLAILLVIIILWFTDLGKEAKNLITERLVNIF